VFVREYISYSLVDSYKPWTLKMWCSGWLIDRCLDAVPLTVNDFPQFQEFCTLVLFLLPWWDLKLPNLSRFQMMLIFCEAWQVSSENKDCRDLQMALEAGDCLKKFWIGQIKKKFSVSAWVRSGLVWASLEMQSDACIECWTNTEFDWHVTAPCYWLLAARSDFRHRQHAAGLQRFTWPSNHLLWDQERGRPAGNVECHDGRCSCSARWYPSSQTRNCLEGWYWTCCMLLLCHEIICREPRQ